MFPAGGRQFLPRVLFHFLGLRFLPAYTQQHSNRDDQDAKSGDSETKTDRHDPALRLETSWTVTVGDSRRS